MLTAPNKLDNIPLLAANQINELFLENCPKIFSQNRMLSTIKSWLAQAIGPKYNNKFLHSKIQELLEDTSNTNFRHQDPLTYNLRHQWRQNLVQLKDPLLSDVCISSWATPTYLPAHYFETNDSQGNTRGYNLVDGGLAANNPTLLALEEILEKQNWPNFGSLDCRKLLVISLDAGSRHLEYKFSAKDSASWGILRRLYNKGTTPLMNRFTQGSAEMVDIYASTIFRAVNSDHYYLRIQDDTLTGSAALVDISTEENLLNLSEIGKNLLKKPVSRMNSGTGTTTSNEGALTNFEEILSKIRRREER